MPCRRHMLQHGPAQRVINRGTAGTAQHAIEQCHWHQTPAQRQRIRLSHMLRGTHVTLQTRPTKYSAHPANLPNECDYCQRRVQAMPAIQSVLHQTNATIVQAPLARSASRLTEAILVMRPATAPLLTLCVVSKLVQKRALEKVVCCRSSADQQVSAHVILSYHRVL